MSTYAAGIALLLLVLSPLHIPVAVTVFHGVSTWRANRVVTTQVRQRKQVLGEGGSSSARPRLRAAQGDTAPAKVAIGQTATA
jgi:hypothetical protein